MAKGKKTGGRQKGSGNKTTQLAKDLMTGWLNLHNTCTDASGVQLIWQDFTSLDPKDRVKVTVEFIKLLTPRDFNITDVTKTIEDRLVTLSSVETIEAEDTD